MVYTATITITPKANYTVKGIAENGYTVNGAQTVTNEADSATVTAVYSATGIDDTVDTNEFTKPLLHNMFPHLSEQCRYIPRLPQLNMYI